MVKTTIIARISDGLPLAASMDDEQVLLFFYNVKQVVHCV
jgi:hypothetical protein